MSLKLLKKQYSLNVFALLQIKKRQNTPKTDQARLFEKVRQHFPQEMECVGPPIVGNGIEGAKLYNPVATHKCVGGQANTINFDEYRLRFTDRKCTSLPQANDSRQVHNEEWL